MATFDSAHPRQAAGVTTGGQFVTKARQEADVDLGASAPQAPQGTGAATADAARELMALWSGTGNAEAYYAREAEVLASAPEVPEEVFRDDFYHPMLQAVHCGDDAELERLAGQLDAIGERERAWRAAGYQPPGAEFAESPTGGPVVYQHRTGSKYDGFRDVAQIAKDVRADLKAAQKAGYLPPDMRISVRSDKYSMGQAMRLAVSGLSDEDLYQPKSDLDLSYGRRNTAYAREVRDRIEAIAKAYDQTESESQTDYYHGTYHCFVELIDAERAALYARA
ncbi:hypothetical protein [Cellulosimicrobium sp. Marseille-Q4280]|uniref:hypothetical protein n=1 Tax=Cellulosimicrobium sp. Marseille-Q4280 TaxID=2937992 RepID=UPI00203AAB2E|nr:hypothetical protein [Cellulosimicrobium sp. Marseille-Q4280]